MGRALVAGIGLALFVAVAPVHGAAQLRGVLIGINDYPPLRSLSDLDYAVADATALRDFFVTPGGGQHAVDRLVLMTDESPAELRPTRASILAQLDRLRAEATAADTILVYFAGHGVNRDREDYLLPMDVDDQTADRLIETALPVSEVTERLIDLPAEQVLLIVDACRSTPEQGAVFGSALRIASAGAERANASSRLRATLTSACPGQRAFEWPAKGHGVFTWYLLEGLAGAAAEGSGEVTAHSLARFVRGRVEAWTRRHVRGRELQSPRLLQDGAEPLVLLRRPPDRRVTILAEGAALGTVMEAIAQQSGLQLALGRDVPATRRVDLSAVALPLAEALGNLLEPLGLAYQIEDQVLVVSAPHAAGDAADTSVGPIGRDRMPLVLVPGGAYQRGSDHDRLRAMRQDLPGPAPAEIMFLNELPPREVVIDSFYLDVSEVPCVLYQQFIADGGYDREELWVPAGWAWRVANQITAPASWPGGQPPAADLPVTGVSWYEADAYARWAGRRLPTEAEWEYAAQGGLGWRFPYGEWPDPQAAVYGREAPEPVMRRVPNPFGLFDLAGNAAEWCQDVYDPDFYGWGERHNPLCAASLRYDMPELRSVRGGGYRGTVFTTRSRKRHALPPTARPEEVGFRCAADLAAVAAR